MQENIVGETCNKRLHRFSDELHSKETDDRFIEVIEKTRFRHAPDAFALFIGCICSTVHFSRDLSICIFTVFMQLPY